MQAVILAGQSAIDGDLEFYCIQQVAGLQLTLDALQHNIDKLLAAADVDHRKLESLSRTQARTQRMQFLALKELKDLQSRRNVIERFPEQTAGRPPLADQFCFVGDRPIVKPASPPPVAHVYPPAAQAPMNSKTAKEGESAHLVFERSAFAKPRR